MITEIHPNSYQAYHSINKSQRRHIIQRIYEVYGSLTDRQVCDILGFRDLNSVRPRISEMIDDGVLVECGNKKDEITHKTVRLVKINTSNNQFELGIA